LEKPLISNIAGGGLSYNRRRKREDVMNLGFIGLGNMGLCIARELIVPGNQVTVFDVRPEVVAELQPLGATAAACAADVARASDIVGVCVRTDQEVRDVLEGADGILAAAKPGLLVAIHSTIKLSTLRDLARKADAKGVRLVDAPVSRGTNSPKTKAIVFMVGGAPEDVACALPFIELAALKIVRTGALGTAMTLKVCNNLLTYLTVVSAADAVHLAEAAGLDVKLLADVTATNGVAGANLSYVLNTRAGIKVAVNRPMDTAETNAMLGEKDLDCALEVGRDLGVELPAVAMARTAIRKALLELAR
jgi:3-hydroxyisobutyrate dehydrogenase-like beta-hydroxyacid dehydrogenase